MSSVRLADLPWLSRASLPSSERLIRFTDGPLAGQLAIVCPSDPSTDPEDDSPIVDNVYTKADWEECSAPSLVFDSDGDLVWYTSDCRPGTTVVAWEAVEVAS